MNNTQNSFFSPDSSPNRKGSNQDDRRTLKRQSTSSRRKSTLGTFGYFATSRQTKLSRGEVFRNSVYLKNCRCSTYLNVRHKYILEEKFAYVPKEKLPEILKHVGWNPTPKMMALAMDDVPNKLSYDEFIQFIQFYRELDKDEYVKREGFTEEEVDVFRGTFARFDVSGDGLLDISEMVPLMVEVGREPTTAMQRSKIAELISLCDEDGNGEVDFNEFLGLMRKFTEESEADLLCKAKKSI
jgi:Ca2+-binding EF-hand superfamily protein